MKFKGQKGFSLVEVMITVAILVILLAIAVPNFQRFAINSDLRTAARDIAGDFFIHKERAIAENRQYRITFNVGTNSYTIGQREPEPSTTYNIIQTKILADFEYRGEVSFVSTTANPYNFQPRGTVTNGTIVLINSRNSTATITINITGKASVQFNML